MEKIKSTSSLDVGVILRLTEKEAPEKCMMVFIV